MEDNGAIAKTPDVAEKLAAIWSACLFAPDQVVELRAIKVSDGKYKPWTEAGYFDRDHLADMARAAMRLTSPTGTRAPRAKGVYFTLNPVNPALLARIFNRVERVNDGETTKDTEILVRRLLLIDCDPKRPSGISASDQEKAEALKTCEAVRDFLAARGWPDPITADSGNGYHLIYRVDLPTDDGGMVQKILTALGARFDSAAVEIDKKVFNPSRICKLPYTFARKGDETNDRPHRRGKLLSVPPTGKIDGLASDAASGWKVDVVPTEMLEALAAEAPTTTPAKPSQPAGSGPGGSAPVTTGGNQHGHKLVVEAYLNHYGVKFRPNGHPGSQGQTIWTLEDCPFDATHKSPDSCVMQFPSGATHFDCQHNSCQGYKWKEFREKIGSPLPDHWDPPKREHRAGRRPPGKKHIQGNQVELDPKPVEGPPAPDSATAEPVAVGDRFSLVLEKAQRGLTTVKLLKAGKLVHHDQLNIQKADNRTKLVAEWRERFPDLNGEALAAALLDSDVEDGSNELDGLAEGEVLDSALFAKIDDTHILADLVLPMLDEKIVFSWRSWRGDSYRWRAGEYMKFSRANATEAVTRALKKAVNARHQDVLIDWGIRGGGRGEPPELPKVTTTLVSDVENVIRSERAISDDQEAPCWLEERPANVPDESDVIPCRNGLLIVPHDPFGPDPELIGHTRHYFTLGCLPFDYDANAPEPVEWLKFLETVWPGDQESKDALAEHMGYALTDDTRIQKHWMMIGPPRSGKGVILRALAGLVGKGLYASSSLTRLGRPFGLAQLPGKRVLALTDARVAKGPEVMVALENLLKITGNDDLTVERKHRDEFTGHLGLHVVIAANDLPKFDDDSNALAERFIIFTTKTSFAGREDPNLDDRIAAEMPSLLLWCLEGLARLRHRKRYVQPESGMAQAKLWRLMASPFRAFVEDCCVVMRGLTVRKDDIWKAWKTWAEENNTSAGSKVWLGRLLNSTCPEVVQTRPRGTAKRQRSYEGIGLRVDEDEDNLDDLEPNENDPGTGDLANAKWSKPDLGGIF